MSDITKGLISDYKRDKANGKLERVTHGIVVPTAKIAIGGVFGNSLNGDERQYSPNLVVDEGLTAILDIVFSGGSIPTGLYIGLILTGTPAPGNTLLSKGFTESTDYTGTDWPIWDEQGVSGDPPAITNAGASTPAQFTMGGTDTPITGAFMCGASTATKGGTSGTLYAASLFGSSRIVGASDVLDIDYTLSMDDA